jgi:hypothetical protein
MNKKTAPLATVIAMSAALFSFPALAAYTCTDLLTECQNAKKFIQGGLLEQDAYMNSAHCLGYLQGFADAGSGRSWKTTSGSFCLPPGNPTPNGQLLGVFLGWVERNPDELNTSALGCTLTALWEAFPCPTQGAD